MIGRLIDLVRRLRDPVSGCDWDRVQTCATIAPFTIEEAYEVADAIARRDMPALRDELGDLLFQVVLLAQIASDNGDFGFGEVVASIIAKMERRHPHIFGDAQARPDWETIKAVERTGLSALAGVATALPASMRAQKLQARAARVGFDWPDMDGPRAKISEELAEIASATTAEHQHEEVGDLLFSVVNYARHLKVDAETALRDASDKFTRRFNHMEAATSDLNALDLPALEQLWTDAKRR